MTIAVMHSETARGEAALAAAAEEAVVRGEQLAVLNIIPGADKPSTDDPDLVERLTKRLSGHEDLKWTLHTAPEEFDTAEALLDLADEVGATRLVIGAKRRTPVGKLLLGSLVQKVLLDAHLPVLVVKATDPAL